MTVRYAQSLPQPEIFRRNILTNNICSGQSSTDQQRPPKDSYLSMTARTTQSARKTQIETQNVFQQQLRCPTETRR